jgi:iron only hydrogenase large subunit-like protein
MPCYDKKLEAVRPTMLLPNSDNSLKQVMEVDTVLATHEIADLLTKKQIDFKDININGSLESQLPEGQYAILSLLTNSSNASSKGSQMFNQ